MAKLKLHIEQEPLELVKKKIARHAAALSKQNGSSPNGYKAGHKPKTAIKNLHTR